MGNSYGGWLAANVALLRPDLLSRAVMISPPLVFTEVPPGLLQAPDERDVGALGTEGGALRRWFVSDGTFADESARLWLEQFSLGMPNFRGMNGFPRPKPFSDDELRSITVPVLLIEGADESMHDPEASIAARPRSCRRRRPSCCGA